MRLIIIFFLVSSILCDKVFDQIFNVMVNKSIDPCDNFYHHVCGVNAGGDLRTLTEDLERTEYMNSTVFDDVSEYMVEIIHCTDEAYTGEIIRNELRKQFNKACQNGHQETFLKNVEKIFNITINETVTCGENQEYFDVILKDINDLFIKEYQSKCTLVLPDRHYQLWLYRNREVISRMNNLFEITKTKNYEWVENTKWINNRNFNEQYRNLLNVTHFEDNNAFLEEMNNFTNLYSDCKELVSMWLEDPEVIKKICVRETFKINTNDRQPYWSIARPSRYGARNFGSFSYRTIKFSKRRYILANLIQSEALFFGTTGFIMAHEMGHSLLPYTDLYFTENGIKCVQNQIKKSCEYFNKASEEVSNPRYTPNQVRFNAIAAQSSEFQKAFQCSPESRMMRSAAEKCHLFGKEAPEN